MFLNIGNEHEIRNLLPEMSEAGAEAKRAGMHFFAVSGRRFLILFGLYDSNGKCFLLCMYLKH